MGNIEQLFTLSFALGALMISIVYGIYAFQTKLKSFLYWHAYWCLLSLANFGLLLTISTRHIFGSYVYTYTVAVGTYAFVLGAYAYIERKPRKSLHLFMSLFLFLLFVMSLFENSLTYVPMTLLLLTMSFFACAASAFLHEDSKQRKLYGIAILLLVTNQIIYLFSYETAFYDAIGYIVLNMTGTVIGFGPIALYHFALYRKQSMIQDRLYFLSYHDSLTRLKNRAHLEEILDTYEIENTFPFSIVMIDLNNLKEVNDSLGHDSGDELLIETASLLKHIFNTFEHIIRLGGDEFLILLPKVDEHAVDSYKNDLKESVANSTSLNMSLSIAIGAATRRDVQEPLRDVIRRAEKNMYADKLQTRKELNAVS